MQVSSDSIARNGEEKGYFVFLLPFLLSQEIKLVFIIFQHKLKNTFSFGLFVHLAAKVEKDKGFP